MSLPYSLPPPSSALSSVYSFASYDSDDDDSLSTRSLSSFYQSSSAASSTYSLYSQDSNDDDPYSVGEPLELVYPSPSTEGYSLYDERPSFAKQRPSSDLLASDRIFTTMQNYLESKKELDQLAGERKDLIANSVCLTPDFIFSYVLAKNKIFAMMQKNLNEKRPDELGAALKDLLAKSDHFAPDFIFALVKPQLERLRVLPCDLLDVLNVFKNMANTSGMRDVKTSNELEEMLARLPKNTDETQSEKIHSKEKTYLDKISAFLGGFYDNAERNPSNVGLLTELVAKPLIIGAVNFIAAQYLFPAIHRRWA